MNRVLHLGLGNFHRAHQAWYFEKLNALLPTEERWEITSFSMQRPDMAREHATHGNAYEVLAVDALGEETTRVKSITRAAFLGEDEALLVELARDPSLELVTLTVTEKGYAADGPALKALELILRKRSAPLTILSCDNLMSNGHKLEKLVRERMGITFPRAGISFPCSMVDRIVPASPPGAPVKTERFTQWVVEDKFAGKRPPLEKVGVQFVPDVAPAELMKLRLLNAGHSFLAYWGLNRGFAHVHEAVAAPETRAVLEKLWNEVIPLLSLPSGSDPQGYCQRLLERFNNPRLPHKLAQIACDGSAKLPQRIVPSLLEARKRGSPHGTLALVLREWSKAMAGLPPELFTDPAKPFSGEADLWSRIGTAP